MSFIKKALAKTGSVVSGAVNQASGAVGGAEYQYPSGGHGFQVHDRGKRN